MHIVYVDEVKYDKPTQPYYWLCGLAFSDAIIQSVDRTLSQIGAAYFGTSALDETTEFHARDIVHGKRAYNGQSLERRVALFKDLLDVIDGADRLGRIAIRIDPAKMIAEEHASKAFMFLVEKVDEYMAAEASLALLIADNDKQIAGMNVRSLTAYKARGTPYAFGRPITHVIDTIHHTDSRHSRLLQLADIFTYTLSMVHGERSAYPRSEIAAHARAKRNLLFPTKYKWWPTDDSWSANA